MRHFFVADLNTRGELREVTEYDYATLEKIAGAADLIGRHSQSSMAIIVHKGVGYIL